MDEPTGAGNGRNGSETLSIEAGAVLPPLDGILRLMGVPAEARSGPAMLDKIPMDEARDIFLDSAEPRARFVMVDPPSAFSLLFNKSPASPLGKKLAGSARAAVFAATVGPAVETAARRLIEEGRYLLGTVLDAMASEAVELLADKVQARVELLFDRGGCVRFSPGYGDWSIEAQVELLALAGAGRIGVSLTDGFMMLPRKTVSGVIVPRGRSSAFDPCAACKKRSSGGACSTCRAVA